MSEQKEQHDQSGESQWSDMQQAYQQYQQSNPQSAAGTTSAGGVAKSVIEGLRSAGVSMQDICKNTFVLFDMIQKHGSDVRKITEEFKKLK